MSGIILVGINDTAPSIAAANWALERARSTLDRIVIVHVLNDVDAANSVARDHALAFLAKQAISLRISAPETQVTTELLIGNPLEELTTAASAATLLVIGTHKTGFVQGRVFGSKYIQLAATTPIPLAVIPMPANRGGRAGVVVGLSDSRSTAVTLDFAIKEARRTLSSITLVHSWTLPNMPGEVFRDGGRREFEYSLIAEKLLDHAKTHIHTVAPDVPVRTRSLRRPPAEGLLDAAGTALLLVLGRTAPGPAGGGVLGATVHDVLVNLTTATMIVPPENDRPGTPEFQLADTEHVAIA
ncbi:universal stress protein [Subtercola boreus]|uniref:universal stress protein n=1 Tax=Subtercola boreus TaxID=120213 RepID=UPI00155A04D6|nr:universal stress protein [Subtercola boreus]